MELRDYQAEALHKVERREAHSVLVVAPTGAGKGTMAAELLTWAASRKRRAVFCVHRRELAADMRKRLEARGIRVADDSPARAWVHVLTVQTLLRSGRPTKNEIDIFVVDEAHHYAADEWNKVIEVVSPRKIIGFTATPQRPDGRSMGDMFSELVDAVSYSELLSRGFVVPCRVLRPHAHLVHELAQHPADAYMRYGRGEQALMFVARVVDANAAVERLREYGVPAAAITGERPTSTGSQRCTTSSKGCCASSSTLAY
jgi:superfamily II DNA or RNA helicase